MWHTCRLTRSLNWFAIRFTSYNWEQHLVILPSITWHLYFVDSIQFMCILLGSKPFNRQFARFYPFCLCGKVFVFLVVGAGWWIRMSVSFTAIDCMPISDLVKINQKRVIFEVMRLVFYIFCCCKFSYLVDGSSRVFHSTIVFFLLCAHN